MPGVLYARVSGSWVPVSGPGPPGTPGADGAPGPAGADGSTILNGSGPPSEAIGEPGDYYLDEAADILYGPRSGGTYPDQVAEWAGPFTGAMTGGYTFGMRCIFARAGEVRGVNLFVPAGYEASGYEFTVSLWTTGGTRLASKAQTTGWVANAWNRVPFDTPVAVTATTYLVSYHNAAVRISAASGVFPVEGVTSGDIRIPTNAESPNQSVYASGDAFPTNAFWPTTEPVSPIFREVADETWPVAVEMVGPPGPQGIQGVKGDTGATGSTGAPGAPGVVQSVVAGPGIVVNATDVANPIVAVAPGFLTWTAMPFTANWVNSATYAVGSYRKLGDIVYLRGHVTANAGVSSPMATLPTGFRPAGGTHEFPIRIFKDAGAAWIWGSVQIGTDGNIIIGAEAWAPPVGFAINHIFFSVTA